jgi:hypothetical protein
MCAGLGEQRWIYKNEIISLRNRVIFALRSGDRATGRPGSHRQPLNLAKPLTTAFTNLSLLNSTKFPSARDETPISVPWVNRAFWLVQRKSVFWE